MSLYPDLPGRHAAMLAEAIERTQTDAQPDHAKRVLMRDLLTSPASWPQGFQYAVEYDWWTVPGQGNMGRGDVVLSNHDGSCFLVVAVKVIKDKTLDRKQVRVQALQARGGFVHRPGRPPGLPPPTAFAAVYTTEAPSKVIPVAESVAEEQVIRAVLQLSFVDEVKAAPATWSHWPWVKARIAAVGSGPAPALAAVAAAGAGQQAAAPSQAAAAGQQAAAAPALVPTTVLQAVAPAPAMSAGHQAAIGALPAAAAAQHQAATPGSLPQQAPAASHSMRAPPVQSSSPPAPHTAGMGPSTAATGSMLPSSNPTALHQSLPLGTPTIVAGPPITAHAPAHAAYPQAPGYGSSINGTSSSSQAPNPAAVLQPAMQLSNAQNTACDAGAPPATATAAGGGGAAAAAAPTPNEYDREWPLVRGVAVSMHSLTHALFLEEPGRPWESDKLLPPLDELLRQAEVLKQHLVAKRQRQQ